MAVVAYCVKCKAKKEMVDPQEGVTKNGRVITKGTCPDCGTKDVPHHGESPRNSSSHCSRESPAHGLHGRAFSIWED